MYMPFDHSDDLNGFNPVHFYFYMVRMIVYDYCGVKGDLKKFLNQMKEIFGDCRSIDTIFKVLFYSEFWNIDENFASTLKYNES